MKVTIDRILIQPPPEDAMEPGEEVWVEPKIVSTDISKFRYRLRRFDGEKMIIVEGMVELYFEAKDVGEVIEALTKLQFYKDVAREASHIMYRVAEELQPRITPPLNVI